jgi:hypothetical protein
MILILIFAEVLGMLQHPPLSHQGIC